jgi:hypothetical protein
MGELFGLNWTTVLGMPSWAWAAIVSPIVVGLLARAGRVPARSRSGWKLLEPSIGIYALALVGLVLALLFSITTVVAALALFQEHTWLIFFLAIASPVLAFLGWYFISYILFVRISFNEFGIESRIFGRRTFVSWGDLAEIRRHWFFGPLFVTKTGKRYFIWEYLKGFQDCIQTAQAHGVPVKL